MCHLLLINPPGCCRRAQMSLPLRFPPGGLPISACLGLRSSSRFGVLCLMILFQVFCYVVILLIHPIGALCPLDASPFLHLWLLLVYVFFVVKGMRYHICYEKLWLCHDFRICFSGSLRLCLLPPWWCLLRPSYLLLSCSFSAYDDGLLLSRDDQLFPDGVLRCGL